MSGFVDQYVAEGFAAGPTTVCVIGGGFSGTMVVANVVRGASEGIRQGSRRGPVRVVLIDDREEPYTGVAYGTRDPEHLLNVPAGRMSAWAVRPDDFLEFARGEDERVKPGDFVARVVYGRYLKETLRREVEKAGEGTSVEVVKDRVIEVREVREVRGESGEGADGARWVVRTESGREVRARAVVLTIGHRPPTDPLLGKWKGSRERWIGDPWSSREIAQIGHDDDVVILGTGLTAVDVMATLTREEAGVRTRSGRIVCVSRRGMLPRAHLGVPVAARDLSALLGAMIAEKRVTVRDVLAVVREQLAEPGVDWRSVIDGLRPMTQRLWAGLSDRERRRFMGKVRPLWEVHRHRMAPRMAERIEGLLSRGMVRLVAGRVEGAEGGAVGVELKVALRSGGREVVRGAWVINCTGPTADSRSGSGGGEAAHPVVASLIAQGHLVADALGLGVLTGERGEARDARGELRGDLMVVGTLRKPDLWESTAVPELRVQAAAAAKRVLSDE